MNLVRSKLFTRGTCELACKTTIRRMTETLSILAVALPARVTATFFLLVCKLMWERFQADNRRAVVSLVSLGTLALTDRHVSAAGRNAKSLLDGGAVVWTLQDILTSITNMTKMTCAGACL